MKRLLLLIALSLCLMGQSCESPPADPGYCSGSEGVVNYTVGGFNTIIGGELATDRRSAVLVLFGNSYCSGNVVGKRTVLVAAHCGYGATTTHRIKLTASGSVIANAPTHFYHPDYQEWIDRAANTADDTFEAGGKSYDAATGEVFRGDPKRTLDASADITAFEGRKADLMFLYTDTDLPTPFINTWYDPDFTNICTDMYALGYGKDEFPDEGAVLRESKYRVKKNLGKLLVSEQATWGGSCFGDSGSCLLVNLGPDPANRQCAGVLSTTASADCLVSANYVNTDYFRDWLDANLEPPS